MPSCIATPPRGGIIALLCCSLLLPACAGMGGRTEPPTMTLSNIEMLDATLFEQRFELAIRVTNPNDHALRIRGGSADLEINGIAFASGVSNQSAVVEPYSDAVVTFTAATSIARVIQQFARMADRQTLDYRLTGRLSLSDSGFPVRFDQRGEFDFSSMANWNQRLDAR